MWVQGKSGRERIVGKRLKATQSQPGFGCGAPSQVTYLSF